jgi:SAM-dependent methyltransferase
VKPGSVAELLACPSCRGVLSERSTGLACSGCGHLYPLLDGTPNLLLARPTATVERATGLVGNALGSVAAIPGVYDVIQRSAGARRIYRIIQPILQGASDALVLDVGGGTGNLEALLPASALYVWLDSDPKKLRGFHAKSEAPAILGDATSIPLRSGSVDWAVCVGVSHHLEDDRLGRMLDELRRVLTGRLFFLDAVLTPTWISKLLWRYDRGRHPRTADALRREIRARFRIVTDEEFAVLHEYLLVTAR